jgi:hypothetical protein
MKPDALAKFLQQLETSRTRNKTLVRFELHDEAVSDKAYVALRNHCQDQGRVCVVNLGRENQAYVLGPTAASDLFGLTKDRLYGVFVLRGERLIGLHPSSLAFACSLHPRKAPLSSC